MPLHAVTTRPARVRIVAPELATTVLRGIGFQARCSCGHPFPIRKTWQAVAADKRQHRAECATHGPRS